MREQGAGTPLAYRDGVLDRAAVADGARGGSAGPVAPGPTGRWPAASTEGDVTPDLVWRPVAESGETMGDAVNSNAVVPSGPARGGPGFWSVLWALIPALSFGFLAPIPFLHAAARLGQRRMWAVAAAYALGWLLFVTSVFVPEDDWALLAFSVLGLTLMGAGTTHAFLLRGRVFTPPQPALAAELAAKQRRAEARAIAAQDVALACGLRIGRPDLPRQFDDGGLIDVNRVPAQVLMDGLGLSPALASQIAEARDRLGGYSGPDELIAYTDLPPNTMDALGEWLLFIPLHPGPSGGKGDKRP